MQLEYLQPEQLQLQPGDVPKKGRWPHIRVPLWPFNAHLVSPAMAYKCQMSHYGGPHHAKHVYADHNIDAMWSRSALQRQSEKSYTG